MNHKRKTTKRRVRCTICTPYRWLGNNKGRFGTMALAENRDRQKLARLIDKEVRDGV
jgi:hypothetical protein